MTMLGMLMDGRALTATELCAATKVTAATVSAHLKRLEKAAILDRVRQGRHSYFRIANPEVAHAIETLLVVADWRKAPPPSTPDALRHARTWYDHAAGAFAVTLFDDMLGRKWLALGAEGCSLTADGRAAFGALGVDVDGVRAMRRRFAYPCLDWSERKFHLAGALGAVLLDALLRRKWIRKEFGSRRLLVEARGRDALRRWLSTAPSESANPRRASA